MLNTVRKDNYSDTFIFDLFLLFSYYHCSGLSNLSIEQRSFKLDILGIENDPNQYLESKTESFFKRGIQPLSE